MPDVLTVSPQASAADAVDTIRAEAARLHRDSRTSAYIYVTDPQSRLLGVVPFRDLVLSAPDRRLRS